MQIIEHSEHSFQHVDFHSAAKISPGQAIREVLPQCGPILYLTGDVGRYGQDHVFVFSSDDVTMVAFAEKE